MLLPVDKLKEALSNLAWDCASGWIGDDGVDGWSEEQVIKTSKNIIESLTKGE